MSHSVYRRRLPVSHLLQCTCRPDLLWSGNGGVQLTNRAVFLCLSVALFQWPHSTANARVFRVPGQLPTIQAAFDTLSNGDTVLIAPGTYGEALQAPPFEFWLLGDVEPGDSVLPIIDPSVLHDTLHLHALTLPLGSAGAVERIRFRNRGQDQGVRLEAGDATFRHCAFDSLVTAIVQDPQSPSGTVVLDHCQFRYYFGTVIIPVSAVLAQDCLVFRVHAAEQMACGAGSVIERCVFVDSRLAALTNWGSPVTIRNCLFTAISDSTWWSYVDLLDFSGLFEDNLFTELNMGAPALSVQADCEREAVMRGNIFHNCQRPWTYGYAPLMHVFCDSVVRQPYRVEGNVMTACTTGGVTKGIHAENRGHFVQNRLYDLHDRMPPEAPAVYAQLMDSMVFRENLFYNNGYAMQAENGEAVDARWNWWGDETGPYHATQNPNGQGDTIVGEVDFDPWHPDTSFLSVPGIGKPLPEQFVFEAYPNPFNSTVTLKLIPSEIMIVRVELFDVLGRRVKELWSGPLAFEKQITFDSQDLASGIYFARVWQPIGNRPLALTKLVLMK